jgi:hypothetical protein
MMPEKFIGVLQDFQKSGNASCIKNGPYSEKALIPKSPWIKAVPLQTPTLFIADNGSFAQTSWSIKNAADVFQWVLFTQYNGVWQTEILTLDTLSKIFLSLKMVKS